VKKLTNIKFEMSHAIEVTEKEIEEVRAIATKVGLPYLRKVGFSTAKNIEHFLELYLEEYQTTIQDDFSMNVIGLDINYPFETVIKGIERKL